MALQERQHGTRLELAQQAHIQLAAALVRQQLPVCGGPRRRPAHAEQRLRRADAAAGRPLAALRRLQRALQPKRDEFRLYIITYIAGCQRSGLYQS